MNRRTPPAVVLARDALHASLSDPLLEAMNFLNEVTSRYPTAISFAPGRPYEGDFEPESITDHLATFTAHLRDDLGMTSEQVRTTLFQYGRTKGFIHELIARTVENDEAIRVDPEAVVVTVGCQEAMLLVLRALFASPEDVLLVSSPCYVGVTGIARLLGIEVAPVPEGPDGITAEAVGAAARALRAAGRRPRALYVVPDFANPSGLSMTVDAREELLEIALQEDVLVLEDNPYGFFIRDGEPRPTLKSLDRGRRVVYFGSFAKTVFPGARVGYVLADQEVEGSDGRRTLLADELSKIKSMTTVNTPALTQAVIGGMLLQHDCRLRDANKGNITHYRENLQTLLDELDRQLPVHRRGGLGIDWNVPDGGFFLVMTVPFTADDSALERSAQDYQVLWTPMSYFHLGTGGTRQLRLSCSALDPERIREGVTRLVAFLLGAAAGRPPADRSSQGS
ncbi:aminotransferase-like domain-containing protein [Streptomyces sp. NPDC003011]